MNRVRKIHHVKLGKRQAWGIAEFDEIFIDTRVKGRKHLEISIHETLHVVFPNMDEDTVLESAKEITRILWTLNYRRVDNDKGQPLQVKKPTHASK